jgi:hypothetical protein
VHQVDSGSWQEVTVAARQIGQELVLAAGELLDVANSSEPRSLSRLVDLAARQVPGCSGATAVLWHGTEPVITAASHPDLSELIDLQQVAEAGPVLAAVTDGSAVSCPDMLRESRWPDFAAAALLRGVRCSLTLVRRSGQIAVTLTLYGARPRSVDPQQHPIGELLVAFGGAVIGNASTYGDAQRTARQLLEGAESRALVDQAKGMLMSALSCSAEDALRRMRDISQSSDQKVTDVARKIIESHGVVPG